MKNVTSIDERYCITTSQFVVGEFYTGLFSFALIFICTTQGTAQESHQSIKYFSRHHSLSLLLGHTQTGQGSEDGKQKWIALPSWALDYNYHLTKHWSIGLHNDVILESFKVKDHATHQQEIERTRPIATIAIGSYKFLESFSAEVGAGAEYAKEGTFFLNRLGFEYAYELRREWEVKANLIYDIKWQAYNSFCLGVGVGKSFGFKNKSHHHVE